MENPLNLLFNNLYVNSLIGIASVFVLYYLVTKLFNKFKNRFSIDIHNQSENFLGDERIRSSRLFPKGKMSYLFEDAQTLYECLLHGQVASDNGYCLGWREFKNSYKWLCYSKVIERVHNFGSGLICIGAYCGSHVGIYSQNIVEYIIAEQACYSQSVVVVPLYDTLELHACRLIVSEAELEIVICDTESKVLSVLEDAVHTPSLTTIVVVNTISDEAICQALHYNIKLYRFAEIEEMGQRSQSSVLPPLPQDLAVICYTSGTTGNPKGVMLTHSNIVANISAVLSQFGQATLTKDDVFLSFLPLAHMFERCCQMAILMVGGKIGFFQGDIRNLSEDIMFLKPTVFPCVPRILNKMHDNIMRKVNANWFKRTFFKLALAEKQRKISKCTFYKEGWLDWMAFQPIRSHLGGRIRMIVMGAAPTSGKIVTFFRHVVDCVMVEGYGQTECAGPCTLTFPEDNQTQHVGPPLPCCQIKLVDVPSMNYFSINDEGEICVKGPTVFAGYFKDAEKTKSTIDENGWLHTGDVGAWLPNGTLRITDRIKNIFKLAQGEYVSLEKIENIYDPCSSISQVLVYGESLRSCLVGIVIPDQQFIAKWCKKQNVEFNLDSIFENILLKNDILKELTAAGKEAGLNSFEQVKAIHLSPTPFSVENNFLTPTMKIKRKDCYKHFMSVIHQMYCSLER